MNDRSVPIKTYCTEKEFGAKPSEKKMMMKRKMRRLEAKPEHESGSVQRVSSRCK